jgi:hypothetical protein
VVATHDSGRCRSATGGVVRGRHALAGHKSKIKNDPSCGSGISTSDDGGSMVFCVCSSRCCLGADSMTSMLTTRIRGKFGDNQEKSDNSAT